jgi:predicted SnoaL-like aldol condensation-catalyzing enzyme
MNIPGDSPKEIVLKAITELFVHRDIAALDRYWSTSYVQHNPQAPNGTGGLRELFASGAQIAYEVGLVVAEDDLVVVHGRYSGLGPKPLIAVDILRVENGKISEHWDVLQEEVAETVSGNRMFEPAEAN